MVRELWSVETSDELVKDALVPSYLRFSGPTSSADALEVFEVSSVPFLVPPGPERKFLSSNLHSLHRVPAIFDRTQNRGVVVGDASRLSHDVLKGLALQVRHHQLSGPELV